MKIQRTKLELLIRHPAFHVLATLGIVLGIVWGTYAVTVARIDAAKAEWELNHQTWMSCGKPWGEPCDCPKEGCLCGIVKGRSCLNCRPMK